jgi:predicted 3-demethylubiquinone-9 3-methyltransferase (glyoxalase superfamily)
MFQDGNAEAAMRFYVGLIEGSSIQACETNQDGDQVGKLKFGAFTLGAQGNQFIAFDSPIKHAFEFTAAMSIFVDCQTQEEQDKYWTALTEGGFVAMPLDNYGFSKRFGFCGDKYGVSWQINLP